MAAITATGAYIPLALRAPVRPIPGIELNETVFWPPPGIRNPL